MISACLTYFIKRKKKRWKKRRAYGLFPDMPSLTVTKVFAGRKIIRDGCKKQPSPLYLRNFFLHQSFHAIIGDDFFNFFSGLFFLINIQLIFFTLCFAVN